MGHLQTMEQELRKVLETGDAETVVRFVKEAVLASYRNGVAARSEAAGASAPAPDAAQPRPRWQRHGGGRR